MIGCAWKSHLASTNPSVRQTALDWLEKINDRDAFGSSSTRMPPPQYHSDLSDAQREELRQYLKLEAEN